MRLAKLKWEDNSCEINGCTKTAVYSAGSEYLCCEHTEAYLRNISRIPTIILELLEEIERIDSNVEHLKRKLGEDYD